MQEYNTKLFKKKRKRWKQANNLLNMHREKQTNKKRNTKER